MRGAAMTRFAHLLPGRHVDISSLDAASAERVPERAEAEAATLRAAERIGELQEVMYAQGHHSLLAILQGMDGSGKDGTVRRVFRDVDPVGIQVTSFKTPTPLETRHDFLWRTHKEVPPRGIIGVFNRSYYEEVLIVRVHADRFLPPDLRAYKHLWRDRFSLINDFEHLLTLNGTRVLKFFLHISKDEQRQRFEDRQADPTKHWKLAASDFEERKFWADYQAAYERMLENTSTKESPWHIIPSDRKWVRNYHISQIVARTMESLGLKFPPAADKALVTRKFK